jgi:hypothetical protein
VEFPLLLEDPYGRNTTKADSRYLPTILGYPSAEGISQKNPETNCTGDSTMRSWILTKHSCYWLTQSGDIKKRAQPDNSKQQSIPSTRGSG